MATTRESSIWQGELIFCLNKNVETVSYKKKRLLVAERDNWVCQLCKLPIEKEGDFTIDHIKPRCNGGKNNIENLQSAHQICNLIKGDSEAHHTPEYYIKRSKDRQWSVIANRLNKNLPPKPKEENTIAPLTRKQYGLKHGVDVITEPSNPPKEILKKPKPPRVNPKSKPVEIKINHCAELWNEISRYGLERLSYNKFKEYFDNYKSAPSQDLELKNKIRNLENMLAWRVAEVEYYKVRQKEDNDKEFSKGFAPPKPAFKKQGYGKKKSWVDEFDKFHSFTDIDF